MRKIITIITAITIAAVALAEEFTPREAAWFTTQVLANDLNATTCAPLVQEVYEKLDGNCYELDFTPQSLHRSLVDLHLGRYKDMTPIAPWAVQDGNYSRVYRFDGKALMFVLADFGSGSIGGFVPLNE